MASPQRNAPQRNAPQRTQPADIGYKTGWTPKQRDHNIERAEIALPGITANPLSSEDADPWNAFGRGIAESIEGLKGDDKMAYEDLEYYSRYVVGWGNRETVENSKILKALYRELQYSEDDILALCPRGSGKSSAITVTNTTWQLGRNPLLRFLIAFNSKDTQGDAFLRQIKQIITSNERYIRIFGELKPPQPEKWDSTEIIVARPTPPGGQKDSSVFICGLGSAVPSKRADWLVCDDLIDEDNAYSDALRRRAEVFVTKTLYPILVPGGRKVFVGTTWDPRDLYEYIANSWHLPIPGPDPDIDLHELMALYEGVNEARVIEL